MIGALHRFSHYCYVKRIPIIPTICYALQRVLFAAAIPPAVSIGKRVTLGYQGLGTVIHARAVIGDDVTVGPNVTIGGRSGHHAVPIIESGVYIGAGARVLGPITVGKNAVIGANAVVVTDVEPFTIVAGIPAKKVSTRPRVDAH
jgi:serine O-acetyltransferase